MTREIIVGIRQQWSSEKSTIEDGIVGKSMAIGKNKTRILTAHNIERIKDELEDRQSKRWKGEELMTPGCFFNPATNDKTKGEIYMDKEEENTNCRK